VFLSGGFIGANLNDSRNTMKAPTAVFLAVTLVLAACTKEAPVAPAIVPPVLPPPSPPAMPETNSVWLSAGKTSLYEGEESLVQLRITTGSGQPLIARPGAIWTSSNPAVASVSPVGFDYGRVVGVSVGSAIITAKYEGKSDSLALWVAAAPFGSAELVIESFSVLELEYSNNVYQWWYAPQIVAKASDASNAVEITNFQFSLPGLDNISPCRTNVQMPTQATQMFASYRGDFQLEFTGGGSSAGQVRATGPTATAIITVTDSRGVNRTMVVTGPIVRGPHPIIISALTPWWHCSF
jgi:hypothetical protein